MEPKEEKKQSKQIQEDVKQNQPQVLKDDELENVSGGYHSSGH